MARLPRGKRRPRKWRLGLRYGTYPHQDRQYLGWAAIGLDNRRTGPLNEVETDDPVAAAVSAWLRHSDPKPTVELYRFTSEVDFHGSRAEDEGLSLVEHHLLIARAALALRNAGAEVIIVSAVA